MKIKPVVIFVLLCVGFITYSFSIYLNPIKRGVANSETAGSAIQGRLVWQKYNCQSCHQLYGLGGYLGPDLTNVVGYPDKGEALVRMMVINGSTAMPAFHLPDAEMTDLIAFLQQCNNSGIADPRNLRIMSNGMIEHKP